MKLDVVDAIAIAGAILLTFGAGLLIGSMYGLLAGIGVAALVLGGLLIAYAIPASRSAGTVTTVIEESER